MKKIIGIVLALIMLMSVTLVVAGNPTDMKTNHKKVIIGFVDKPNQLDENMILGLGGKTKYTYHIINAKAVEIPEQAIDDIKKNPRVKYVEEDIKVYALDTELDNSWGVTRIGAGVVHGYNKGAGVKVAIIDTGIDKDHPDLQANIKGGVNFVSFPPRKPADPEKWDDDNGHGTHCAGIVAALDNEEGVIGVAPEAHVYGVKVLDRTGSGYDSDVIAGIQWSMDNGMQVISMSLGGGHTDSMKNACDEAENAGIVVVAAAGNSGPGDNTVIYPAKYDSVIAVSATQSNDELADWSSRGSEVELAAPGVSIYSTYIGGGYDTKSGTSMACPHVAGTAALILASPNTIDDYNSDCIPETVPDNSWTNEEVRAVLQVTADDLGTTGIDNWYGYGLVDADEAAPLLTIEAVNVVLSTDKVEYVSSVDTTAVLTAVVTDESGAAISSLDSTAFVVTLDTVTESVSFTEETATPGTYTGELDISTLDASATPYTVKVIVTDTSDISGSDTASFSVIAPAVNVALSTDKVEYVSDVDTTAVLTAVVTDESGAAISSLDSTAFVVTLDTVTESVSFTEETATPGTYTGELDISTLDVSATPYTVKVTVTDTRSIDGSDTASFSVVEVLANVMHVSAIEMWSENVGRNYKIYTKVTIVDTGESPVEGATVSLKMTLPTDGTASGSGVTGPDGTVTFEYGPTKLTGTYTSEVTNVVKSDWTYEPTADVESSKTLTVL